MSAKIPESAQQEYSVRVLYSLLKPAARMADRFRIPMKEFTGLIQRSYYQAKKARGLTLREIADELQMSTRTADRLAKSTRSNFFSPEHKHELPRQVEFLLWSGAKSEARLLQLLPGVELEELREALASLRAEGRVTLEEGRTPMYRETRRANRLPDDSMAARVDGLNHLLAILQGTVWRRFFLKDVRAGARAVGLRVRREDLGEIEALYEEVIWNRLLELDDQARLSDEEDVVEVGVAMCWSPMTDEAEDGEDTQ